MSILKFEKDVHLEILVFENDSQDGSLEMLEELASNNSNIHITNSDQNIGFARGNNALLPNTSFEYVLFLNPDTEIFQENTLGRLVDYLEDNPKVGVVGPKIIYGDGRIQYSCGKMPSIINTLAGVLSLPNLFPSLFGRYRYGNWNHNEHREVIWVSGACMLVRGNEVRALDGFDPQLIMYAEDVDLCLRIKELGYKVIYNPDVLIKHFEGQSSKQTRKTSVISGFKSYIHFYYKYKGYRQALILKYALIGASLLKICVLFILNLISKGNYKSILESYYYAVPQLWLHRIQ
jgi:GT2 family glycosyltransferase